MMLEVAGEIYNKKKINKLKIKMQSTSYLKGRLKRMLK